MLGFVDTEAIETTEKLISANDAAKRIIKGLERESFLIFTDTKTENFMRRKVEDYDKWILAMQNLHARATSDGNQISLGSMYKLI